jgi:hypothetical protein
MLVLQSSTDSLQDLPSTSSEIFPTSSDCTYGVGNVRVEEDVDVTVEIAANRQADTGIRQEEVPEEVSHPDIKSEPVIVGYVCVSVIRHILHVSSFFKSIFLAK